MLIVINAFQIQTTSYNSMAVPAVINIAFIKFPSKDVPKKDLQNKILPMIHVHLKRKSIHFWQTHISDWALSTSTSMQVRLQEVPSKENCKSILLTMHLTSHLCNTSVFQRTSSQLMTTPYPIVSASKSICTTSTNLITQHRELL